MLCKQSISGKQKSPIRNKRFELLVIFLKLVWIILDFVEKDRYFPHFGLLEQFADYNKILSRMGDYVVLNVNSAPDVTEKVPMSSNKVTGKSGESSGSAHAPAPVTVEDEPLIPSVECRICQEEDDIKNLDSPCACSGSLKVFIFSLSSLNTFSSSIATFQIPKTK